MRICSKRIMGLGCKARLFFPRTSNSTEYIRLNKNIKPYNKREVELMLEQEVMISKVRNICKKDKHLINAMMYGSFAKGGGDTYSDIEFAFFFEEKYLERLDKRKWLKNIYDI